MNIIKINSCMFSGSQSAYTACKLLAMSEELSDFITGDETFNIFSVDDYIQVNMYSTVTNDARDLFHFKKSTYIEIGDFYSALVHYISTSFSEELI